MNPDYEEDSYLFVARPASHYITPHLYNTATHCSRNTTRHQRYQPVHLRGKSERVGTAVVGDQQTDHFFLFNHPRINTEIMAAYTFPKSYPV